MRGRRRLRVVLLLLLLCALIATPVAGSGDVDTEEGVDVVGFAVVGPAAASPCGSPSPEAREWIRHQGLRDYHADLARLKEWGS